MASKITAAETRLSDVSRAAEPSIGETGEPAPKPQEADFCPVRRALDLVGARWTLVLVRHLLSGPRGFSELRDLTGITPRLLTVRLSQLMERGLVEKVPVGNRFHYALTEFGMTLDPIVHEVAVWWVRHAMRHFGPYKETTPASVLEALSFLLRRDRAQEPEITYDLRLTVKEGGGWKVEFSDAPARQAPGRQSEEARFAYGPGAKAREGDGRPDGLHQLGPHSL
ncbi:MAG: helix-turn-helix domain-containing protein [Rhodospirillaceae bacterium]|nr:helix-turn-helix domain-containing protein [Rhodospirillaceae bacterium]